MVLYKEKLRMREIRIFISWSGELSKSLADILSNWLPRVIQTAHPFYSTNDIGIGNRWFEEIESHLSNAQMGVLCITEENVSSQWIMFEAGALARNLGQGKVIPLLFGINYADINGPLTQ